MCRESMLDEARVEQTYMFEPSNDTVVEDTDCKIGRGRTGDVYEAILDTARTVGPNVLPVPGDRWRSHRQVTDLDNGRGDWSTDVSSEHLDQRDLDSIMEDPDTMDYPYQLCGDSISQKLELIREAGDSSQQNTLCGMTLDKPDLVTSFWAGPDDGGEVNRFISFFHPATQPSLGAHSSKLPHGVFGPL